MGTLQLPFRYSFQTPTALPQPFWMWFPLSSHRPCDKLEGLLPAAPSGHEVVSCLSHLLQPLNSTGCLRAQGQESVAETWHQWVVDCFFSGARGFTFRSLAFSAGLRAALSQAESRQAEQRCLLQQTFNCRDLKYL